MAPGWVSHHQRKQRRDPLDLNLIQDKFNDNLLYGLNVFTNRARYFSAFCWMSEKAVRTFEESEDSNPIRKILLEMEKMWILSWYNHHLFDDEDSFPAKQIGFSLREDREKFIENSKKSGIDLNFDVFKGQRKSAFYNYYIGPMTSMGLIRGGNELEDLGKELGETFPIANDYSFPNEGDLWGRLKELKVACPCFCDGKRNISNSVEKQLLFSLLFNLTYLDGNVEKFDIESTSQILKGKKNVLT